jgi:hypothetical protein
VVFELFHEIAHAPSAKARRYVVDHYLEDAVRFRNLAYPEARADFEARGGQTLPALWDGERLHQGAEAVVARLGVLTNIGRAP